MQITAVQYLAQNPLTDLPASIAQAGIAFEEDVARVMRAMASKVSGKPVDTVPDIRISAARVQQEISRYYQDLGVAVSSQASDVIDLTQSLASILAPLYEDIRAK